jgi:hypothetical protein
MIQAAAFNGGEAAPMTDDIDSVALQCRGRRGKVRGESIWMERERAVMLTDNGGRQRCLGRNRRGGGLSGGGSQRGGRIGDGEGGELELERGCGTEWSEASAASPSQRARGGRTREGNGGRGSARCRVEERKWERERWPRARWSGARGEGRGWQRPSTDGRERWRCCVNRGERWGTCDTVWRG